MGYLDNTTQTVDAILTKKGRELLARGENVLFQILRMVVMQLVDILLSYTMLTHVIYLLQLVEQLRERAELRQYFLVILREREVQQLLVNLLILYRGLQQLQSQHR